MRQMRKKIIIAIIVTLLLTAGIAFAVGFVIIKGKDTTISTLESRIVDTSCLAFSKDLKAGDIITQEDITKIEIKLASLSSGTYKWTGKANEKMKMTDSVKHMIANEKGVLKESTVEADKKLTVEDLVGRVVKSNVSKNTLILDSLLYAEDEEPTKDERLQEFNFIQIPSDLNVNDYIDVRIQFPTGEDYSVLIGKRIEKIAGENTIFIKMDEEEIMAMSSAIIEAYMQDGVRLYANKYTDPATQLFNESIVDYVEKYDLAVEKLMNEKMELALRKAAAQKFVDDGLYAEIDPTSLGLPANIAGMVKYTAQIGDEIIVNDEPTKLTEAKEIDLYVEKNDEKELLITVASMNDVSTGIKEELKEKIEEVDVESLENEILASYAGLKEDYVEEIKLASMEEDEDVLDYYRIMRVTTRESIIRSFPVRDEVLAVVKNNPNLVETIKAEFDTVALTNTRIDEYKRLEALYNTTIDEFEKQEIKQKMEDLRNTRIENIEKSIEAEVAAQRAERVSYLESLVESTTSTTEE